MNKILELFSKIPKALRNKYAMTFCFFLFYMIFLDKYNLFTQFGLQSDIRKLNKDRNYYEQKLEKVIADKEALSKNIEKFARERYLMHKPNEEVYIIVDKHKRHN